MRAASLVRRILAWTIAALAAVLVLAAGLVTAVNAGYGHALLVRTVAARVHRPIQVNGTLQAHLFSRHPQIVAEGVTIDNPPWMPAGRAADIGRISMVLELPGFSHRAGIVALDVEAATLYLARDALGHANWQLTYPPKTAANKRAPIIRSLTVPNAHVILNDALRHLQFDGTVSVQGPSGSAAPQPLRIAGSGQLNGRADSFELTADPLATASHEYPYHFTFAERSSGSRIAGRGVLSQPFAYDVVDATFESVGPDLKDLYFLTGVHLIDTGDYRLTGRISRRQKHTVFSDLVAKSGQSDMRGTVAIDATNIVRRKLDIDLNSQLLRLSDLGIRAAGRATEPKSPLLLSDAMLSLTMLRSRDVNVKFRAHELAVGRLTVQAVSAKAVIDHGVVTVAPLSALILGGRVNAHLGLDASHEIPTAKVDIRIIDLQLGQFPYKDPDHPPIEGPMQAQVSLTGAGSSIHEVAASANGTVTTQLPHGSLRDSFAELTGLDLRGLGLLLTRNKREVPIRCAIAKFSVHEGTLVVQSLVADTEPVLITGEGQIHLDSESLDLDIRGRPKSLRLFRLRAPITVRGTLAHPSLGIQTSKSSLKVVDPGEAKDADCPALLAGG
jgi:AsmA family protein